MTQEIMKLIKTHTATIAASLVSEEYEALREVDVLNAELRARNEERLKIAKEALGAKYVLHPANAPKKLDVRRVLD